MVGIFTYTLFSHVVYTWDSTVMIAFLVILVGTFAIANQYKYGYSGWHNENLEIMTAYSESPENLKPGGL